MRIDYRFGQPVKNKTSYETKSRLPHLGFCFAILIRFIYVFHTRGAQIAKRPTRIEANSQASSLLSSCSFSLFSSCFSSPAGSSWMRAFAGSLASNPGHGAQEIKANPFFASINWERLAAKRLTPPYLPMNDEVRKRKCEETKEK